MKEAISTTNLTEEQKVTLSARFLTLLLEYKKRARKYSYSFNILRTTITVGSLIVPALLSVQYVSNNSGDQSTPDVYWVVWNLSLLVTISNGLMTMLKVDKKYFLLNTTYQHLQSEGWQFVHLSGKYSGFYTPHTVATHHNQFIFFCNSIEKIRMRQVEDEYYKVDTSHTQAGGGGTHHHDQLVPPTPVNPAKTLNSLPFSVDDDKKSVPSVNEDTQTPREFGQRPRDWDRAEVQSPSASYETDKGQGHSSTVRRKNPAPAEKHETKEIQFTYPLTTAPSTPSAKAASLSTIDEGSPDEHA